ncbi:MAG TPA: FIST N-terminal domain-containing protein [Clostridia bacterium]|nr:FIST N-terminal domain-containing protein [Clostridia bacterium]
MDTNTHPKIEIGYGIANGISSFETGMKAAKQAVNSIHMYELSVVLVYTSVEYNLQEVLQGIKCVAGEAPVLGTSTAGEVCNGCHNDTVLVVALASPFLKVHCGIGTGVSDDWQASLKKAIESPQVSPFFHNICEFSRNITPDGRSIFIMLFTPGNTKNSISCGYEILEALKAESLGIYPVFGGSSLDGSQLEVNYVLHNTEVYKDSILLAVFETELQFGISLTHGFIPTDLKTVVTLSEGYKILELDGMPAQKALSNILKISEESLKELVNKTGIIFGISNPMGQYSLTFSMNTASCGGIEVKGRIKTGTVLTLMGINSEKMLDSGTDALRKAIIRGGISDIAVSFVYCCKMRSRFTGDTSKQEITRMMNMLGGKPLVGYFSGGEQGVADDGVSRYNTLSISCLVLGNELSQIAQVAIENKRLVQEAMEYDKLKSEFFSNISHEFRTPINVILGTLQLMELENSSGNAVKTDDKTKHHFKTMKQNCYRLMRLTNNLIDMTKIESGFCEINLHNQNIIQVVEDITMSVADYVRHKGLELVFDTDAEEIMMAVDADKIEKILLNLLSNAVKFSKPGGEISVNIKSSSELVVITVKDNGIGIPQDKLDIIFERFRQVDSSLTRNYEGSGIGLSLVKNLVELHGGRILVSSEYGKGSEFTIELPVILIDENIQLPSKPANEQDFLQRIIIEFSDLYAI